LPDVSGLADVTPGYATYCTARPDCVDAQHSGRWQAVGGTSAATPLLAGAIALINEDLHRQGKQFVGRLNPLLYQLGRSHAAGSFYDVTSYGNDVGPYIPGNGRPLGCCSAAPGFDLASGWGSVDVANLDRAAVRILPQIPNVSLSIPSGQHPLRSHRIIVTMSCSDACRAAALVVVSIHGGATLTLQSSSYNLTRNQRRSIPIPFTSSVENRLRAAVSQHHSVFAEAFGALLDGGGNVIKLTAGRQVAVTR
jgi:hypothetical protein